MSKHVHKQMDKLCAKKTRRTARMLHTCKQRQTVAKEKLIRKQSIKWAHPSNRQWNLGQFFGWRWQYFFLSLCFCAEATRLWWMGYPLVEREMCTEKHMQVWLFFYILKQCTVYFNWNKFNWDNLLRKKIMRWISLKDISIGIDCNSNQNDTGCFKSQAEVVGHCYSYSGCQEKRKSKLCRFL